MATSTAGASVDTLKTLEQACSRNVAADLHVLHPEQGVLTARTRLLSLIEGHVYMDRPQSIGRPLDLRSDQPVDIHFLLTGTRYAFRTRITRPACYVRLNASQQVLGAAAALPDEVKIQQRRADFRISLAARGDISILIHGGTDADGGSCRIDQPRVVGRLLNISAGGLGVRCDLKRARDWQVGGTYFTALQLPETEHPLVMMTALRHVRPPEARSVAVLGFKFLPWSVVPLKRDVQLITRFIAAQERRSLRRGR